MPEPKVGFSSARDFDARGSACGIAELVDFRLRGNLFYGDLPPIGLGIGPGLIPAAQGVLRGLRGTPLVAGIDRYQGICGRLGV